MISIALIVLLLTAFLFSKYSSKKLSIESKKYHRDFIDNIRKNWKLIKIKTSDCQIIKFDALINENQIEKKDENFLEWFDKNPESKKKVIQKKSKIICNYIQNNIIEKQYVKIIDMDYTVVEFKVRVKDYIHVYVPNSFNSDDYYIDLKFLEQPIKID